MIESREQIRQKIHDCKSAPFTLCLIFKMVYEELRGAEYVMESRDQVEAKRLLELNLWNSEEMETKLRAYMPQYFEDTYWKEQNSPAKGLFVQFHKFAPKPPRKKEAEGWFCDECYKSHIGQCPKKPQTTQEAQ
jgi:hypothetical protein